LREFERSALFTPRPGRWLPDGLEVVFVRQLRRNPGARSEAKPAFRSRNDAASMA
jgi:hypothetical protein